MSLMRRSSLRFVLLCLVATAIVPVYILLGLTAFELHDRAGEEALRDARQLSQALARGQERIFRDARELLLVLASVPVVSDPAQQQSCNQFLANVHKTMPRYSNIGIATPKGDIYCSAAPPDKPVNIADRAYFQRAVDSRQFSIGNYLLERVTGRPSITVSFPLLSIDGSVRGVIFTAIDLAWLKEALLYADLPAESSVKVVDFEGTALANYPTGEPPGTRLSDTKLKEAIRQFLARPRNEDARPMPASWIKTDQAYAVAPITNETHYPFFVWTELSRTPVVAEIERKFIQYLLWIGIATLMIFSITWIFSGTLIINAIQAIATAARRFAAGELSARTGLKQAPVEIARLADTFDQMAEEVESRENRIMEISSKLVRTNRILKTLSGSNRTLLHAVDENALLDEMCKVAVGSGGFRAAWVGYRQDDEKKSVKPMAFAGLEREFFEALDVSWDDNVRGNGVCGRAVRSGEIVIADRVLTEPGNEPRWDIMKHNGIESAIALPLIVGGNTIGIMTIYATEQNVFTGKDLALLDELAADLSFGIETIRSRAEHTRTEAKLHHLAWHDPGTGLPNQIMLRHWLDESLQVARDSRLPVALLAINLPRMREIGDILGYHIIDQCITRIAKAVQEVAGSGALVAREGRFTLAVALRQIDINGATALAGRLATVIRQPFKMGPCSMEVEACIGIAVFPGQAKDPDALIGRASLAAQHALATGQPHAMLDANPEEVALKRLTMLGELRNAINNNELVIHYQPKTASLTGRMVGAEALVRWKHPVRGMIPPGDFIPVAEHTGLIVPLTYQVLRLVAGQLHAWRQKHGLTIPVAVNLSAQNLHDAELSKYIDGLIGTWGLERQQLQIEITESMLMRDPEEALKVLTHFSNSGMQLFIDDFGTGHSSLAYLASLPVHAVKIDRGFVNKMTKDAQHLAVVHSILSLASSLELKVVAEGVETQGQADMLCELSCDELQGYLISRPLPAEEFINWALQRG